MPLYSYVCLSCGPFSAMRRLADFDQTTACPSCGGEAGKILSVPAYLGGSARQRAYEGSGEPRNPQARPATAGSAHGMSCLCCSTLRPLPKQASGNAQGTVLEVR